MAGFFPSAPSQLNFELFFAGRRPTAAVWDIGQHRDKRTGCAGSAAKPACQTGLNRAKAARAIAKGEADREPSACEMIR
jgi:hypothetical protein